uniref:Uncharacterized protein n=1 Tax=Pithovirus LCPAC201 TaxID=2506591 RepID=A0A481Z6A9_9VIRU|nr:MAG: hypothetical protein LCPAC201_02330 [Pithovirus LCPAC201]
MSDRLIRTSWYSEYFAPNDMSKSNWKIDSGRPPSKGCFLAPSSWKGKINGNKSYFNGQQNVSSWTKTIQTFINAYPSDLAFQVIIAFWIGIIFAPWSWGLLYLIIFFVVFELIYAMIHRDFSAENIIIRITVIGASFLGWLVGRLVVEDARPIRAKYKDKYCRLGCKNYEIPNHSEEIMEFDQVDKLKMEEYLNQLNLN